MAGRRWGGAARAFVIGAVCAGCLDRSTEPVPLGTGPAQPVLVASVDIPANYGIHDTFIRDGLAFVCAWNTGVMIYDVGKGIAGGSPSNPQLISTYATPGGQVHNAWWFWNPKNGEKKYLFIGQEGPGAIGSSS